MRPQIPSRKLSMLASAALVAGATLAGGCVVAPAPGPPARVAVRPPVVVAVHVAKPGWEYFHVRGTWYYAPRGTKRFRHNYFVLRSGVWVHVK